MGVYLLASAIYGRDGCSRMIDRRRRGRLPAMRYGGEILYGLVTGRGYGAWSALVFVDRDRFLFSFSN
jgi:hypothetical protein